MVQSKFVCQICNKEFVDKKHKGRLFCSQSCKNKSPNMRDKVSKARMGMKFTPEHKRNLSKARHNNPNIMGARNPAWKGGITPETKKQRHSLQYKAWRLAVFERDNFTCLICGARGVSLEADHIKSWANYPELRFVESNGRTLCKSCHYVVTWGKRI